MEHVSTFSEPTAVVSDSPRRPGRRVVLDALLATSLVLAALSGPLAWFFYIDLQFFGAVAEPADYQGLITVAVVTAALLAVGELAVLALRGHWVHHLLVVAGILLQGYLVLNAYTGATAPDDPGLITPATYSFWYSVEAGFLVPTSWPLELLLLVLGTRLLLRATSNLQPRRPRDPSAAPGRPSST